jgi:hypothetical protein
VKKILIGIDPGIHNGFAQYDPATKTLTSVASKQTWEVIMALDLLKDIADIHVYIENPKTWRPFGGKDQSHRLKGAGSVTARFQAIEEYMTANKIAFTKTKIQGGIKKLDKQRFEAITGYKGKTNEHGRDAAMIVFGR